VTVKSERVYMDIPGSPSYFATSDGEIGNIRTGRILKPSANLARGGYLELNLGRAVHRTVHRLVALAFIGPCPEGMEVRHLNGNPMDNRPANLAYSTHQVNMMDTLRHKRHHHANKTECDRGHPFIPENTGINTAGGRVCRMCNNKRRREARRKRQEAIPPDGRAET
jgi:hypothetical protein